MTWRASGIAEFAASSARIPTSRSRQILVGWRVAAQPPGVCGLTGLRGDLGGDRYFRPTPPLISPDLPLPPLLTALQSAPRLSTESPSRAMAEQDVPSPCGVVPADDANAPAPNLDGSPTKSRSRAFTACNACRARRTRCDRRSPACGYCRTRGLDCHYEQNQTSSASR